jgi:hypothetical protein
VEIGLAGWGGRIRNVGDVIGYCCAREPTQGWAVRGTRCAVSQSERATGRVAAARLLV